MDGEPTLPRLPRSLPSKDKGKRARDTDAYPPDSSTSSDPAIFSSDDDPALDNYQNHGRRKRRYVGTWFDQHPASSDSALGDEKETRPSYPPVRRSRDKAPSQPQKREFKRQLDSGVWMGTDGYLTDPDDGFDLEPPAARLALGSPLSPARPKYSDKEQAVQNRVSCCVENGVEDVDLSNFHLEEISDGLLEPISGICPIPTVAKDVAFEQKDPRIKVYLSNNLLRAFPLALTNVEHLTVLSLRANRLVTLPPCIAKLKNLETLNIAQNSLRFLPAELLGLMQKGSKLRSLQALPNPFWVPETPANANKGAKQYEKLTYRSRSDDMHLEPRWTGLTTELRCRTPVQFVDVAQNVYSRFALPLPDYPVPDQPKLEVEPFTELAAPKQLGAELRFHADTSLVANPKGARSLFEMALRACVMSGRTDLITRWLREDGRWPAHLAPAVDRAAATHREGGLRCSVCGRETLVPLARWVEFRQPGYRMVMVPMAPGASPVGTPKFVPYGAIGFGTDDGLVPFMRVGCSWRCVPVRVEGMLEEDEA